MSGYKNWDAKLLHAVIEGEMIKQYLSFNLFRLAIKHSIEVVNSDWFG